MKRSRFKTVCAKYYCMILRSIRNLGTIMQIEHYFGYVEVSKASNISSGSLDWDEEYWL